MGFHLPEFIDEQCDPTGDPLSILLAREGNGDDAYIMHREHMAGATQIIERSIIEQRPDRDDSSTAYELSLEEMMSRARAKAKAKRSIN